MSTTPLVADTLLEGKPLAELEAPTLPREATQLQVAADQPDPLLTAMALFLVNSTSMVLRAAPAQAPAPAPAPAPTRPPPAPAVPPVPVAPPAQVVFLGTPALPVLALPVPAPAPVP